MTEPSGNAERSGDIGHLETLARRAMVERGLDPDFPPDVLSQLAGIQGPALPAKNMRDLRTLLWCSIDNDDSRDLDQLTVAEAVEPGKTKIFVAIADVDDLVALNTAIDRHAQHNTTSVYTAPKVFPMLPEKLSTDLTSLSAGQDRTAVVTEMLVNDSGSIQQATIYRALVRNQAKLAYRSVAAWLEGRGKLPDQAAAVPGLDQQLRLQDRVAQAMKQLRQEHGALELQALEPQPVLRDGQITGLEQEPRNRARELIEDFMIGTNGTTARFLQEHGCASIRRIVRSPQRWDRIRKVAADRGTTLPEGPSAEALAEFLRQRRAADPLRFPDLSLTIVKLLGAGEYVVEVPGQPTTGHFGLAVRDYSHSTAPNRRYPDLLTQRLLKAVLAGAPAPYQVEELGTLAKHCTEQEDNANKVERRVRKSAAALLLAHRIGETFDALVTGVVHNDTWVRVLSPPVEGKLVGGSPGLDVGDRLSVKLVGVNVDQGFIDFTRAPA